MQTKNKKVVFLDRDGVINKKASEHNYICNVKDFVFNKGIFKLLKSLKKDGYEFIVITNQRGIARGVLTEKRLNDIHTHMSNELQKRDIKLLDIYYCPHEIDSCDCRKPKPGMLKMACTKYPINLSKSILISDSESDITMGKKFGVKKNYYIPSDKINNIQIK